jgi:hypothetical protein
MPFAPSCHVVGTWRSLATRLHAHTRSGDSSTWPNANGRPASAAGTVSGTMASPSNSAANASSGSDRPLPSAFSTASFSVQKRRNSRS